MNAQQRAPYGRHRELADGHGPDGAGAPPRYQGETYYERPALKPSHWGWLVGSYYFVGGLAGAAQLIATAADLAGSSRDRTVVRAGRYVALVGVLASPPLLIADLRTPARFYNMLRIFRRTSPMSIGSWTLVVFGLSSTLAATAEALDQVTGLPGARAAARWCGVLGAAAGALMASYTGALSASTSVPLWAAAPRGLPALFGVSSATSALATLTLLGEVVGAPLATQRRLERLALAAGAAHLTLLRGTERAWRQHGVSAPIERGRLGALNRGGALGVGVLAPLGVHVVQQVIGRRSRVASFAAAVATIIGVFIEKVTIVFAGNESARRPADYFRFTQPGSSAGGGAPGT